MQPKKSMTQLLGLKTYSFDTNDTQVEVITVEDPTGHYVRVEDIELLIQKLSQPDILQKAIKALMFGGDFDLSSILAKK